MQKNKEKSCRQITIKVWGWLNEVNWWLKSSWLMTKDDDTFNLLFRFKNCQTMLIAVSSFCNGFLLPSF